jgi:uncharacterized protein YeaO (DUF488 family)
MKTSYFAKFNKLSEEEKEKYYPIAISTTIPKWYSEYKEHHTFISPKNILPKYKNGEISWEQYAIEYIELLNRLEEIQSIYEFYSNIEIEEEKEVVLLCYESSEKNCHRHLLTDYIREKNNIIIEEL